MSGPAGATGAVVSLWRYPVKSMLGEELNASAVTGSGLLGDRAWALVDLETGKVASAKEPRRWPRLLEFRAAYAEPPTGGGPLPAVRITLPGGRVVTSDQPDVDDVLSQALGRRVTLTSSPPEAPVLEEYWPDIEGLDHRDAVTDEAMPAGTFFDGAVAHVLTTSTLSSLREAYPTGRFEVRRFRPNIVVEWPELGFAERGWVGRTVSVGEDVRLEVARECPRCVMTTLRQADLPKDSGILRAAAKQNGANAGVYASVLAGGAITRGEAVRVE